MHAPAFIIDGGEVSKWLRNKEEMRAGVVTTEQEKWTEESACFLFALDRVVAVAEVMDKHLSGQVVLPERHGLAEKGNSVTMH